MKCSSFLRVAAITIALSAVSMLHGGSNAVAQDNSVSGQSGQKVTGVVVSDDNNIVVITADNGERMTFRMEPNAFMPINLVPGSRVEVTYWTSGGEYVSDRILMAYPGGTQLASNTGGTYDSRYDLAQNRTGYDARYGSADNYDNGELPGTAGPLPLLALAGALSVALGAGLRRLGR